MSGTTRARGIDRVIEIFEFLREFRQPVGVGELARRLGAPRSSLYEIISRLTAAGLLEVTDEEGRVYFGRAMYLFADAYLASQPLVRSGRDEVIRLAETTGETTQLCMLLGDKYTVAHMHPGSNLFRLSSEAGVLVPIPWTASGRLLLGGMSDHEIRALISDKDCVLPDGRVIPFDGFLEDIRRAESQGYAVTTGLADQFTTCLAAPIKDGNGRLGAAICFVIPSHTPEERQGELIDHLVASGRKISGILDTTA